MTETKVIKEALPLYIKGINQKAVLIIHGYTGYTGEFYELAQALNDEGYTVSLPRLPGHGTNRKDFLKTGWKDWLNHIQNAFYDLEAQHSSVSIVGLSMGGVLALILASRLKPERIALLAPAMAVHSRVFYYTPIFRFIVKKTPKTWTPGADDSEGVRILGEEYWSVNLTKQLANLHKLMRVARKGLHKIKCPVLIMLSEKDGSVPISAGDVIEKGLIDCEVKKVILRNSHHVLVTGEEKEIVNKNVIQWLNQGDK